MKRRQRRIISQYTSYFIFLFIVGFAWYQGSAFLEARKANKQSAQIAAIQEEEKVLEEVKEDKVVEAAAYSYSEVLSVTTPGTGGSGNCGPTVTWSPKWSCDSSHYDVQAQLTYRGAPPPKENTPEGQKTIYLKNFVYAKSSEGLFIEDSEGTKKRVLCKIAEAFGFGYLCDNFPDDNIKDKALGYCMADGDRYWSVAEVSFSQPMLPGVLAGSPIGMRRIAEDLVVEVSSDFLDNYTVEDVDEFCAALNNSGDYEAYHAFRSSDTYKSAIKSAEFGNDFSSFLVSYCNGRAPGENADTTAEITKEWVEEKDKELTVMKLAHTNNENHNLSGISISGDSSGMQIFRDKAIDKGFGGLIYSGANYLGSYVFQPKNVELLSDFQLRGSAPGIRYIGDTLTAPNRTSKYLLKNQDKIDIASPETTSSTVISKTDSFIQNENERASIVDAIFGGIYYIPEELINKPTNTTLSFDKDNYKAKATSCDLGQNGCTIVKARTGCAGVGAASYSVRLKELYLSTVHDTSQYASIRGDGMISSYGKAGDAVGGSSRSPVTTYLKESIPLEELVYNSGMASGSCLAALDEQYPDKSDWTLNPDIDESEPNYNYITSLINQVSTSRTRFAFSSQAIVVSPVKVGYKLPVFYKTDLKDMADNVNKALSFIGINISPNQLANYVFPNDPDWQYQVKMVTKKVKDAPVKPALVSFRFDDIFQGIEGFDPSEIKKKEDEGHSIELEMAWYLSNLNIEKMDDGKIACGDLVAEDDEEGERIFGYWLCSSSAHGGLPKYGCN